jgi:hypothetical protein
MASLLPLSTLGVSGLRPLIALLSCLSVAACDNPQSLNGHIPYAPVKNGWSDESAGGFRGPPIMQCAAHGVIWSSASFGSGSSLIFDADTNKLIELVSGQTWGLPEGKKPQPIEPKIVNITPAERNMIVRLANLVWAPRHPLSPPRPVMDTFIDVFLIDGASIKALNGFGAGQKLGAALNQVARKHGI